MSGFMWAPDCAFKNGTYYFYYPHKDKNEKWRIGVATSTKPQGPFTDIGNYIEGTSAIDPCVFVDDDGTAYLYQGGFSGGPSTVAKLNDDMISLAEPMRLIDKGTSTIWEGTYMHKRNGIYYY